MDSLFVAGNLGYIDQTLDFFFAAMFFYAFHRLAKKYQMRSRLLVTTAIASIVMFLVMVPMISLHHQ